MPSSCPLTQFEREMQLFIVLLLLLGRQSIMVAMPALPCDGGACAQQGAACVRSRGRVPQFFVVPHPVGGKRTAAAAQGFGRRLVRCVGFRAVYGADRAPYIGCSRVPG